MKLQPPPKLILVTGPAGAGRSTALRALEDLGFETIDNLPIGFMERLLAEPLDRPLALGIDARNRDFEASRVVSLLQDLLHRASIDAQLLYLECDDDVLLRRYSETRRTHPLASNSTLRYGIARDRDLMAPIREQADLLLDTSAMSVHDLRREVEARYAPRTGKLFLIEVQSFSYKRGLPRGLDMVLDVRFLKNPHWTATLRPLDGRSDEVAAYVASDPLYGEFYERLMGLLALLLPAYSNEGKAYLSIGLGCTGGKHRSVALTEAIATDLKQAGWNTSVRHRELERNGAAKTEISRP